MARDLAADRAPALDTPTTARVIGRSFSFRLAAQILSALVNVAGMAVLGNTLAAEGYGTYAFYYALVPLIAALSDLGIGAIVTHELKPLNTLPPYVAIPRNPSFT